MCTSRLDNGLASDYLANFLLTIDRMQSNKLEFSNSLKDEIIEAYYTLEYLYKTGALKVTYS
jgi:hypothetical protein